ncbi:Dabb family protein [Variovorax sp. J31P207]|uniref:Dabb family protein n=1 Tax=Variovorax sp. J31P207 TaxID=3053510 RepID=UPI0025787EE2|nr:Dabb family protein [Variovorax sp. J31P207]MDM0072509.1 Dabb family protein [Variovorax sp. J31P207]
MVKHIVMWSVVGTIAVEKQRNIQLVRDCFLGLKNSIPGLISLEIGVDLSKVDYACDVVLNSEFESWEALEGYSTHPAHLRVRDELSGIRIARHQVDYEVLDARDAMAGAATT